jgi:hypothetical protein
MFSDGHLRMEDISRARPSSWTTAGPRTKPIGCRHWHGGRRHLGRDRPRRGLEGAQDDVPVVASLAQVENSRRLLEGRSVVSGLFVKNLR